MNTEKNKLAEDKKLTSAKVKELGALIANAEKLIDLVQKQKEEGQINSETAREKIDDIFVQSYSDLFTDKLAAAQAGETLLYRVTDAGYAPVEMQGGAA